MENQFIQFLFQMIESKVSDLEHIENIEDLETYVKDINTFVSKLKEIVIKEQ